jgi:hypothetical protein
MKQIFLAENSSKFARLLIGAKSLPLDRFITFQENECRDIGAMMELRIMKQMARELGIDADINLDDLSKYRESLAQIWQAVQTTSVVQQEGAYPGDQGGMNGSSF